MWHVTSAFDRRTTAAAAPVETFTATTANVSGVGRPGLGTVDIVIERWSTDGERDRLVSVLKDKGPDALLSALQKMPRVGHIRTPTSMGGTCISLAVSRARKGVRSSSRSTGR
jgi:hypothetical protein